MPILGKLTTRNVHITEVKAGDTILHNGELMTVCQNNIKHDSFMGTSLFGNNYRSGTILVQIVTWGQILTMNLQLIYAKFALDFWAKSAIISYN